jgi:DNA-binding NarL/FixJ family response regulator
MTDGPVRVAILNDYDLVVEGMSAMLADDGRIEVVTLVTGQPPPDDAVDVVLYDTFGSPEAHAADLEELRHAAPGARLVVYSERFAPFLVEAARAAGLDGYLAKQATADQLADGILRVHAGEFVVQDPDALDGETDPHRAWPGQQTLNEGEAEVLALLVRGCSNNEIAEKLGVPPDTVKSRVGRVYDKLGVGSRTDAIVWGVRNGFEPDRDMWAAR